MNGDEGNALQRLLHWYWITPWQLAVIIVLIWAVGAVLGLAMLGRINGRRAVGE